MQFDKCLMSWLHAVPLFYIPFFSSKSGTSMAACCCCRYRSVLLLLLQHSPTVRPVQGAAGTRPAQPSFTAACHAYPTAELQHQAGSNALTALCLAAKAAANPAAVAAVAAATVLQAAAAAASPDGGDLLHHISRGVQVDEALVDPDR
jgi:hypothetical protein